MKMNEKPYKCDDCLKEFPNLPILRDHIILTHNDKRSFRCQECRKGFKSCRQLRGHTTAHRMKSKSDFKCNICQKTFSRFRPLQDHMRIHTKESPPLLTRGQTIWHRMKRPKTNFECGECGLSFKTSQSYCQHMHSEHSQPVKIKCKICGKYCMNRARLKQHIFIMHLDKQKICCQLYEKHYKFETKLSHYKLEETCTHMCPECGDCFLANPCLSQLATKTNLDCENPFACEFCYCKFSVETSLKIHKLIHTMQQSSPQQCPGCANLTQATCFVCKETFKDRINLRNHAVAVHFGKRKFACDQCEKRFKTRSKLLGHVRIVHEKLKPFVCLECNSCFGSKSSLATHSNVHSGNTPFVCKICGCRFNTQVSLSCHVIAVHAN